MSHMWKSYCLLMLVLLAHRVHCVCPENCKCSASAITCSGSKVSYNFRNMDLSSIQIFVLPFNVQDVDLTNTNTPLSVVLNVTKYKSIRSLRLENNPLSELTGEEFNQLKELVFLDLSSCDLTSISLTDLPKLHTVKVSRNVNLKEMRFQNLPNLIQFWAQNMNLTAIPNVYEIQSLERIYLLGNNIRHIDPQIKKLTQLYELELSINKLSNTLKNTESDEAGLHNLKYNRNLTVMYLHQNSLQYIPDIFPRLRDLTIEDNMLSFLNMTLPNLSERLRAWNNRIQWFHLKELSPHKDFNVQLMNNPIECSCSMTYLRHKPYARLGKIKGACHEPKWLRDMSLETFAKRSADPCLNCGRCVDHLKSIGQCKCPSIYYGRYCEKDVTPCSPNLCLNNSTCFISKKAINGYFCQCDENHFGLNCEIEIDCGMKPCQNGGTCVQDAKGFHCQCLKSFTGRNCLTIINDKNSNCVVTIGILVGFLALIIIIAMVQCCFIMRQNKRRMSDDKEKGAKKVTEGINLVKSGGRQKEQNNLGETYTNLNLRDVATDECHYQPLTSKVVHYENKQPKEDNVKGNSVMEYNYLQLTPSDEPVSQQGKLENEDSGYEISLKVPLHTHHLRASENN